VPGKTFSGKIIFISPQVNSVTRATSVRVAIANPDGLLKPGMYAAALIHTPAVPDALLVPQTAIIDTGTRQVAFVEEAAGHFSPRQLTTGLAGDDDQVQVLSGLAPGDLVVTSGQFLMDVESRTREAAQKFLSSTAAGPVDAPAPMAADHAASHAPVTSAPAAPASTGESDRVVQAYLKVAAYLQQDHAEAHATDVSALLEASNDLATQATTAKTRALAKAVHDAVKAMDGETLAGQHKSFEKVGAAVVGLISHAPPSSAVAAKLFVLHCPMANADWLQTDAAVKNPFLPAMRTCGSVTLTLPLQPRQ
jgi:hypothetical protein